MQIRLVGTDLAGRIVARFEYDASGNVLKSWRGDINFTDSGAIDKRSYPTPTLPTPPRQSIVDGTGNRTDYEIGRDGATSTKAKILAARAIVLPAGCPPKSPSSTTPRARFCGPPWSMREHLASAPSTPTMPTGAVPRCGKQSASQVSTAPPNRNYSTPAPFEGVVTGVKRPSTNTGPTNFRRLTMTVNSTTGNVSPRTISGFEAGQPSGTFNFDTTFVYNTAGEITSVDPPGSGDTMSLAYDPARKDHVLTSRTDPLVGTTSFGYNAFNQRTTVTDPNLVVTSTTYDTSGAVMLSRAKEIRRLAASSTDDLVTSYTYNVFTDPFCTKLPMGNAVQYVYDTAGRLKELIKGTAVATPTATSCLDPAFARERTVYELDSEGHRTAEDLQKAPAGGSFGATESRTTYVYTCHLDKVTQGQGSANESITEYCYDANVNLEKVWDPKHPRGDFPTSPTQLYEYDELNRVKKVTVGVGSTNAVTTYAYDVQDHLASVTDAESNLTTYTTSDRDLLTAQVSTVSGSTSYVYDARGDLEKVTDARAMVTTRTLDAASRVTEETFGPAGTPDPTLTIGYAYGSTPAQFERRQVDRHHA